MPDQCRGNGNANRHAYQQPTNGSVVIHTQVDGLFFAQGNDIQQRQLLVAAQILAEPAGCRQTTAARCSRCSKEATNVVSSVSYSFGSMTRISVDWMLPKNERQYCADQQHIEHIVVQSALKSITIDECCGAAHQQQIHGQKPHWRWWQGSCRSPGRSTPPCASVYRANSSPAGRVSQSYC